MSTRERLGMSWWNAVIVGVALIAAIVLAVQGNWGTAILMVLSGAITAVAAIHARSGRASDISRLNAVEYIDERDRAIGAHAFAIVGVVALLLAFSVFVVVAVLTSGREPIFWLAFGQLMLLLVAWAIANVDRGAPLLGRGRPPATSRAGILCGCRPSTRAGASA